MEVDPKNFRTSFLQRLQSSITCRRWRNDVAVVFLFHQQYPDLPVQRVVQRQPANTYPYNPLSNALSSPRIQLK